MAKNLDNTQTEETEVNSEVKAPKAKKEKELKANKKQKNSSNQPPKKNRTKETLGELKKVTWPSFSKTMKQTGMVLSLVLVFGVAVLGIDLLISFIINLLSSF